MSNIAVDYTYPFRTSGTMMRLCLLSLSMVCFYLSRLGCAQRQIKYKNNIQPGSCGQASVPLRMSRARIVGGYTAAQHSVPFIVSLRKGNFHYCAGALIRANKRDESNVVLTAAHCVSKGRANFNVVAGAHRRSKSIAGQQNVRAMKVVIHPNYGKPSRSTSNDIAIVKLSRPIKFSNTIQPACLPVQNEKVPDGTKGVVAGWGKTAESRSSATESLNQVTVPTLSSARCRLAYFRSYMPAAMMCAGYAAGGKDACQGDSGGPYFFEGKNGYTLQGLVSWGAGCARRGLPGVYARVSTYIDWIQRTTRSLNSA